MGSVLSNNPSLNRLVRFNMSQAIFVGLGQLVFGSAGSPLASATGELFSDVIFGTLLLTLLYCAVSSLLGREPDGIPLISDTVKNRMPTIDMFDDKGRFVPRGYDKKGRGR